MFPAIGLILMGALASCEPPSAPPPALMTTPQRHTNTQTDKTEINRKFQEIERSIQRLRQSIEAAQGQ